VVAASRSSFAPFDEMARTPFAAAATPMTSAATRRPRSSARNGRALTGHASVCARLREPRRSFERWSKRSTQPATCTCASTTRVICFGCLHPGVDPHLRVAVLGALLVSNAELAGVLA
jgi:hypothetical protein